MSMTDPLADLLTRIRNANRIGRSTVDIPTSKLKRGTLDVLKREGFIKEFKDLEAKCVGEAHRQAELFSDRGSQAVRRCP